jgi:hypothetical protein
MYLTIGPQCCGKTTYLSHMNVLDINMDSMPQTYEPVPLEDILHYLLDELSPEEIAMFDQDIYGVTIGARIQRLTESECFALILFFTEVRMFALSGSSRDRESPETSCISNSSMRPSLKKSMFLSSSKLPLSYFLKIIVWFLPLVYRLTSPLLGNPNCGPIRCGAKV